MIYEYQKDRESHWYHMLHNLPKNIDYAVLWDGNDLDLLEDPTLKKVAQRRSERLNKALKSVLSVCHKYPEFFREEVCTYDNLRWLHTHIITRSFGSHLKYITLAPLVEMFNHECTEAYFDVCNTDDEAKSPKRMQHRDDSYHF